jgi:hypothetical protein
MKMRLAEKQENGDKGQDENPSIFSRHGVSFLSPVHPTVNLFLRDRGLLASSRLFPSIASKGKSLDRLEET